MTGPGSAARQALTGLVRNARAGDLLQRAVRLDGIAAQLRSVRVDLVEVGSAGAYPAVARAATEGPIERAEGAIAGNLRACRVFGDGQHVALDAEAGDVAVAEVRRERHPVVGGEGYPAQLGRLAHASGNLDERADVE